MHNYGYSIRAFLYDYLEKKRANTFSYVYLEREQNNSLAGGFFFTSNRLNNTALLISLIKKVIILLIIVWVIIMPLSTDLIHKCR